MQVFLCLLVDSSFPKSKIMGSSMSWRIRVTAFIWDRTSCLTSCFVSAYHKFSFKSLPPLTVLAFLIKHIIILFDNLITTYIYYLDIWAWMFIKELNVVTSKEWDEIGRRGRQLFPTKMLLKLFDV